MEEKALIQQAAAGDKTAFEQIVIRYQTQVYNLALRMVNNEADAQDLTQEAFVRTWHALASFQFSSQFSTWLYRLTSNICIDFLRSQKKHKSVSLTLLQDDASQQWDMTDTGLLPEDQIIRREEHEILTNAIASLEPEYREVLILRIVNDCSYQQISQILGIREGTVKSRLSRAREQLRKKLSHSGNFFTASASNFQKGERFDVQ